MKKILFLLAASLICLPSFSQTTRNADKRLAGLDQQLEKIRTEWQAAGFAVAVIEKDRVIYAKGFGYRDLENKVPVTVHTLFAIGSCTKSFTSALLGLERKAGNLDFDTPVREYLPDLKFFNEELNQKVTLRDMMCHRTGIPRHDLSWYLFSPMNSRDSLIRRVQYQEPSAGLREQFIYNNFMYMLLGATEEQITGESWEKNIREKILIPLGMEHTALSIREMEQDEDYSFGYRLYQDSLIERVGFFRIGAMAPAGTINSSVDEMSAWLKLWIRGGRYEGKELLPSSYVAEAISAQMISGPGLPDQKKPGLHFSAYGFGWGLSSYKGHYRVSHGGGIDGFTSDVTFFPADSIGIIVLTNQDASSVPPVIRNTIADRMLGEPFYDWNADISESVKKGKAAEKEALASVVSDRKPNAPPSHPLKEYEGEFRHPGYGTARIVLTHDSLIMSTPEYRLLMKHYHYDVFEGIPEDRIHGFDTTDGAMLKVQFTSGLSGEIESLTMELQPGIKPLVFERMAGMEEISPDLLKEYEGTYQIGAFGIKIYTRNEMTLCMFVESQPEYELIPSGKDRFNLKGLSGFSVRFNWSDSGTVTELISVQPNGSFKAVKSAE